MKRLIRLVVAGLCLFLGALPICHAEDPMVLVTGVTGDVLAQAEGVEWKPLVGETLSEKTKISLKADSDIIELVHLKLQKEIALKGPKDTTIFSHSLAGVNDADWGASMGGIPQDLAMKNDALNQVGAVRDHSTSVQTSGSGKVARTVVKKELKDAPPESSEVTTQSVDSGNAGPTFDAQSSNEAAGSGARPTAEPATEEGAHPEDRSENESAPQAAAPVMAPPPPSPDDEFAPAEVEKSKKNRFAPLSVDALLHPDLLIALPESVWHKVQVVDGGFAVKIVNTQNSVTWESTAIEGWRLLKIPESTMKKQHSLTLLKADAKVLRLVSVKRVSEATVLAALKLESDGAFESAAAKWIGLYQASRVDRKVVEAHLKRLEGKMLKPAGK